MTASGTGGGRSRLRLVPVSLAAALVVAAALLAFVVRPVRVAGASMEPRLEEGDVLAVLVAPGHRSRVRIGDVVLATVVSETGGRSRVVKTVRALARRDDGSGWVELAGENEGSSRDSRRYGRIPLRDVGGIALARIYPFPPSGLRGGSGGAAPAAR